jgi:thiol-disulfide isomerase/thioredoxin
LVFLQNKNFKIFILAQRKYYKLEIMRKIIVSLILCFFCNSAISQTGHDIKISLKNYKDTIAYLGYYQFDKLYIADTCKKVINGNVVFRGKKNLEKGVYFLLSQDKKNCFDFIVDAQTQRQEIKSDFESIYDNLVAINSKQSQILFNYIRYISSIGKQFDAFKKKVKEEKKADSTAVLMKEIKMLDALVSRNDSSYMEISKGTYIADLINLKIERQAKSIPLASNGRSDSIFAFRYYKKHYWDGVNFKDDALIRNQFFAVKLKKYFEKVVLQVPDSICAEIDKIMLKTTIGTKVNMHLLAYFTQTYEIPKIMGLDQVFVYMVDNYFKKGKAKGVYDETIIKNIINRANVLAPLQLGKIAPELHMIDISNREKIKKMGFDTAKTSEAVTKIYYANRAEIEKTFFNLSSIKADYLILIFWDVDCGHCQKEVPKILEIYHDLQKENKEVKVFSVYTQCDTEKYNKYIIDNKLDWFNVYDGVYINNLKEKYDIVTTPELYILDKNKVIKAKKIAAEDIKSIIYQMEKEYKTK